MHDMEMRVLALLPGFAACAGCQSVFRRDLFALAFLVWCSIFWCGYVLASRWRGCACCTEMTMGAGSPGSTRLARNASLRLVATPQYGHGPALLAARFALGATSRRADADLDRHVCVWSPNVPTPVHSL